MISKSKTMPRNESMTQAQSPFEALIQNLAGDGLTDAASELDMLLRHIAWTTGSEFLGAFGAAMKAVKATHWHRMSHKTKACFRDAAIPVHAAWPRIRL
jgi:hypothetical protein